MRVGEGGAAFGRRERIGSARVRTHALNIPFAAKRHTVVYLTVLQRMAPARPATEGSCWRMSMSERVPLAQPAPAPVPATSQPT